MKKQIPTHFLLLFGVIFFAAQASATISYNSEDIVVAFSTGPAPSHTGNTYLVDLGPASQFKLGGSLATGSPMSVNAADATKFKNDLITAGITAGTQTWSLQGANDTVLDSFLSRERPSIGTPSTPWTNLGIANGNTDILTLMYTFGTPAQPSTAANSFIQNTTDDPSYGRLVFGTTSATQAYETWGDPEAPVAGLLDLYQITSASTTATRLGYFDFNAATGLIRFTAAPEPSVSLLLLLSAGAFSARRNRRPESAT